MSPPEVDGGPSSAPPAPGSADAEPKCAEDTGVSGRHGHELVVDEVGDWVHVHVVAREDGPQPAPHGSEERAEHDEARGVARCRGARYPFPVFSVVPLVSGLVLLVQLSLLLLGHFDGLPKSDTPGGWRRFFPRPEWINGAAMAVHAILFFSIAIIRARTPTYHHFHAPSPSGTRRPGEFRLGYIPELSRDAKNYDHDLWGLELAALEQRGRRLSAAVFQRIAYLDLLERYERESAGLVEDAGVGKLPEDILEKIAQVIRREVVALRWEHRALARVYTVFRFRIGPAFWPSETETETEREHG